MHVSECQLENALDCMDSNLFSCTFIALLPQRSFIANAASSADIEKGGFLPCAEAVKRRFADCLGDLRDLPEPLRALLLRQPVSHRASRDSARPKAEGAGSGANAPSMTRDGSADSGNRGEDSNEGCNCVQAQTEEIDAPEALKETASEESSSPSDNADGRGNSGSADEAAVDDDDEWIRRVREQTDHTPGEGKPKRVVNGMELMQILELGGKMKDAGYRSLKGLEDVSTHDNHAKDQSTGAGLETAAAVKEARKPDYRMAVTRYVQLVNLLKDVQSIEDAGQAQLDALWLAAHRNLSLASLKNRELARARRACTDALDISAAAGGRSAQGGDLDASSALSPRGVPALVPPGGACHKDYVVRLRRSDASRDLGRFEEADADVDMVIACLVEELEACQDGAATTTTTTTNQVSLDPPSAEERKAVEQLLKVARSKRLALKKLRKRSSEELAATMSKGLAKGLFSGRRSVPKKVSPRSVSEADAGGDEKLLLGNSKNGSKEERQLLGERNKSLPERQREAQGNLSSRNATEAHEKTPSAKRLSLASVTEIQQKQAELFADPAVVAKLNQMRLDAELDQNRFLLRLKPLKAEVQMPLLREYGFDESAEGLAAMERAIAAHMAESPKVGARAKALLISLMGDIWDEQVYGQHVT